VAVGYYQTGGGSQQHGFLRQADGTIVSFDPPGSTQTGVFGINGAHNVVGNDNSHGGIFRGFVISDAP
jgi:hypothetical protein